MFRQPHANGEPVEPERVKGIEPSYPVWKTGVLPLNYTRKLWQAGKANVEPIN